MIGRRNINRSNNKLVNRNTLKDSNIGGNTSKTSLGIGNYDDDEDKTNFFSLGKRRRRRRRRKNNPLLRDRIFSGDKLKEEEENNNEPENVDEEETEKPIPGMTDLAMDIGDGNAMFQPGTTIYMIFIVTLTYYILKYFLVDSKGSAGSGLGAGLSLIYVLVLVLMQIGINIYNTKVKCGETNAGEAIAYSLISSATVLGVLFMIMKFLPGWKSPFSNTIGFLIVKLMGVRKKMNNILSEKTDINSISDKSERKYQIQLNDILDKINPIYSKSSRGPDFIINELNPSNFDKVIQTWRSSTSMKGGSKKKIKQKGGAKGGILNGGTDKDVQDLKKLVILKDNIAEAIWFMLGGVVVTFFSFSYIDSMEC